MNYLKDEIRKSNLILKCPACRGFFWQPSESQSEVLDCPSCENSAAVHEWVSFIKRKGDGSPNTFLLIEIGVSRDKGDDAPLGYFMCVDTSREDHVDIEEIRFCTGNAGGRSHAIYNKALEIGAPFKTKNGRIRAHYESKHETDGGTLKIYQGIGDSDIRMKTSSDQNGTFHCAFVYFSHGDAFTSSILELIQAMLTDMESRPI